MFVYSAHIDQRITASLTKQFLTSPLASLLAILLCIGITASAFADLLPIPPLNSRVTDLSKRLNSADIANIEASLAQLEQQKGSQVAVLIVDSTSPETIEDYSLRVVDKWKLGRKGVDDGVLLLVALNDRKMRIEVGYGLEGAIPDIAAGRIISEFIAPEFRRGDIGGGIRAGTTQIINLINGEPLPEPTSSHGVDKDNDVSVLLAMMIFLSSFITRILVPLLGRLLSVALITGVGAAIIWFISQNVLLTIFAVFFLGIFSLGFSSSRSSSYRDGGGYGGGFGGGSSGGGGGFGGGGASGGW